jgi:hypothetical protein
MLFSCCGSPQGMGTFGFTSGRLRIDNRNAAHQGARPEPTPVGAREASRFSEIEYCRDESGHAERTETSSPNLNDFIFVTPLAVLEALASVGDVHAVTNFDEWRKKHASG